jgi:hypothetical protein
LLPFGSIDTERRVFVVNLPRFFVYSSELYAFIAASKLPNWFIAINLGAAPSIDNVLFPRAKVLNPEPVASAFVPKRDELFHKSFPVRYVDFCNDERGWLRLRVKPLNDASTENCTRKHRQGYSIPRFMIFPLNA